MVVALGLCRRPAPSAQCCSVRSHAPGEGTDNEALLHRPAGQHQPYLPHPRERRGVTGSPATIRSSASRAASGLRQASHRGVLQRAEEVDAVDILVWSAGAAGSAGMTVDERGRPRTCSPFPPDSRPVVVPGRELGPERLGLPALPEDRVVRLAPRSWAGLEPWAVRPVRPLGTPFEPLGVDSDDGRPRRAVRPDGRTCPGRRNEEDPCARDSNQLAPPGQGSRRRRRRVSPAPAGPGGRQAFCGNPRFRPPWLGSSQRLVITLPRVKKCTPSAPCAWVSPKRLFFQPPKE
ncbi:hypothetical protein SAMN04488546_0200 [Geodermatophilus poikilotrophus]|uniref:Uncharacterized protein n=1 Tax=Geodermatophilus poikilotrophus TaxID=1333667 RepID=A0A1H9YN47_9ACTN|nr:hypothetical protein SAMN04488546_0200 [Geodermatophilus poikilotrophus]